MPERTPTDAIPETEESASDSQVNPENEWTLMFYIAGDAMVSASMISQLKELTDAGYQENTTVLAYFDPNCNGRNAKIYNVNHLRKKHGRYQTDIGDGIDPYVRNIAEDSYVPGLPQIPAALTLRYFLEYSRVYYPAKNYMIFLMGHGVIVGNDAFLPDADDDSAITLCDLGRILSRFSEKVRAEESEFHLVGFHSCSMNSVELIHQLAGTARYMIGTQGTAFPGSWPYRQLLKKIFCAIERYKTPPTWEAEGYPNELVKEILRGLQDLSFYNSEDFWVAGYSSDLSMCCLDHDKVARLDEPLNELTSALRKGLDDDATRECILLAHWESQSYWGENYTDLYDFCERLQNLCVLKSESQTSIKRASGKVRAILESDPKLVDGDPSGHFDRLVVFSDFYGPSYQYSNGLSIFFPWARPDARTMAVYDQYAFTRHNESNSWMRFLEDYFDKTRRRVRSWKEVYVPETADNGEGLLAPHRSLGVAAFENGSMGPPKATGLGPPKATGLGPPKASGLGPPKATGLGPPKPPGLGSPKTGSLGLLHELGLVSEVDWLEIISDQALLWLPYISGDDEAKMLFWAATGPPTAAGLGPPKATGLGPPKAAGLGPPKPVGLGPPKAAALGPPKAAGLGPPKAMGLGPPKAAGLGPPKAVGLGPPKAAGLGLFGLTVIKNFDAPEHVFVTSRRFGHPSNRRRRNSEKAPTPTGRRPR